MLPLCKQRRHAELIQCNWIFWIYLIFWWSLINGLFNDFHSMLLQDLLLTGIKSFASSGKKLVGYWFGFVSWMASDFLFKNPLKNCIVRNGLDIHNIGNTYMADRILPDDNITESAIDHVYSSKKIRNQISAKTLETSSSDHLPVVIEK